MRTHKVIAAAGVAALTLALLGACGDGEDSDDGSQPTRDGNSADDPNTGSGAKIAAKALDTAEGDIKDGTAFDLERDEDNANKPWEVKVASGSTTQYEVRVSADGKSVESSNEDDDLDDDVAKLAGIKLSAQNAAKLVAKDNPGDVTSIEIDSTPDGTRTWQVTLNDKGSYTEYKLDADSGKTLSSEPAED